VRVFFVILNPLWTPHFETELELILQHIGAGDDVFILTDHGRLKYTSSNPENSFEKKIISKNKFNAGMKIITFKNKKILKVKKRPNLEKHLSYKFANFDELKDYKFLGANFGLGVVSSIISQIRDYRFDPTEYDDLIYRALWTALLVYESVLEVIKEYKPSLFYVFNGRFAELRPIVEACRQNNIDFILHERGCDINHYTIYKNSFLHNLNTLKRELSLVCDDRSISFEKKNKIACEWFEARKCGVAQAWFSFIKEQRKNLLPQDFDFNKKNIAIFNSSLDEYESFDDWRPSFYENEVIGLKQIFESFQGKDDIHFYLRIHPNLKGLENRQIMELKKLNIYPNVTFLWPDDPCDSYALLDACDTILTFTSTMGVEAAYWGRPCILAGRSVYEDLGCCYIPEKHAELVALIYKNLEAKQSSRAMEFGYWQATKGIRFKYFKADGLFSGSFLGHKVDWKMSFKDRVILKFYKINKNVIARIKDVF
jgi:hypothetical protein